MANILTRQSGNLTSGTTWRPVESNATQLTNTSSTNTTTSYVYNGTAFTIPSGTVVDGVLLYIQRLSATGTFSVSLSEDGGTTATVSVDVNTTDISGVNSQPSWVFLKFTSSHTSTGGTNYKIGVKSSTNATVAVFRNATAANWARLLRVTSLDSGSTEATATPAATDNLYVHGELTGTGTGNDLTVTMNDAAGGATVYGTVDIGKRGKLTYGTSASTNYYLKIAGNLSVWDGGQFEIGTTGTPIPSTSTAVLEFNNSTNVQFGLVIGKGSTAIAQGNAISFISTKLNTDFTANGVSLVTIDSTGWLSGDKIAVASTTRTPTESQSTPLTANAIGTLLTIAASTITSNHSGTSPTQAEIINLTRNVKIRGISTTNNAYIFIDTTATVDFDYVEIYNMGSSTSGKRGIDTDTTTGTCSIQYSSLYDFTSTSARGLNIGGSCNNITFSYNVCFNIASQHYTCASTANTNIVVTNNIFMLNTSGIICTLSDVGHTFTHNTIISATTSGISLAETDTIGTFTNNTVHSCTSGGVSFTGPTGGTISNTTLWRNNSSGLLINDADLKSLVVDTLTAFGNNSQNINISTSELPYLVELKFKNLTIDAGSTLTSPVGLAISVPHNGKILIQNSIFGGTTTHSTGDINISNTTTRTQMILNNCDLNSGTPIANLTNLRAGSYIAEQKYGQVAGNNRTRFAYDDSIIGTQERDAVVFDTTPSIKLTPSTASLKLESTRFRAAVANGQALTISAKVRTSLIGAGDSATYNGNFPRLILVENSAIGVSSDTVIDTATVAASGAFETLSGTTATATDNGVMEFFVDCDGTTGFINIDTWLVS